MWIAYAENGLNIVDVERQNMKDIDIVRNVTSEILSQLKATVKVDITPKSPYDKLAVEQSLENLLKNNYITFEEYVNALDDDSVMPKQKLLDILKSQKEKQALIQNQKLQAQNMINKANNVMNIADSYNEAQQVYQGT